MSNRYNQRPTNYRNYRGEGNQSYVPSYRGGMNDLNNMDDVPPYRPNVLPGPLGRGSEGVPQPLMEEEYFPGYQYEMGDGVPPYRPNVLPSPLGRGSEGVPQPMMAQTKYPPGYRFTYPNGKGPRSPRSPRYYY